MTADLEQRRRTVRVLQLLAESFDAFSRGDQAAYDAALTEACRIDVLAVSGIQGGMIIGEIPRPYTDPDDWLAYVRAAEDALAEAEGGAGDGLQTGP